MTNNWDTINPLLKEITNRLSMIEKRHEESLTNHASVRTQLSNHQETVHQVQDQLKQLIETGIDPLRKNWDSVGPTLKGFFLFYIISSFRFLTIFCYFL